MATGSPRMATPKVIVDMLKNGNVEACQRCQQRVYLVEKKGPVNGVIFHKSCFKCIKCDATLTLKTYYSNQDDTSDKNIYCSKHMPENTLVGYNASAIGIQNALRNPYTANQFNSQIQPTGHTPQMQFASLNIAHNTNAQLMLKNKKNSNNDHHNYPAYVVSYI